MKPKSVIITLVVLLIIVVAGYFVFFRSTPSTDNPISQTTKTPLTQNNTSAPTSAPSSPTLVNGQTYGFILKQVGNLTGKVDGSLTYKDDTLTVGVRAQNLPEPTGGKFYQAWLMYGTTAKLLATMAHSTDPSMKGDFVLGYQVKEVIQNYDTVVVSLQSSGNTTTIETPLFRGPIAQNQ